jgi:hypothetical protein
MMFRATRSGDLHPFHEVEGQHGGGGQRLVDAWHDHECEVAGRGSHVPRISRLVGEIELLVDGPVELLDDVGRGVDAGLLHERAEEAGDVGEEADVRLELLADAGALYLDRNLRAPVGPCPVDLGDGGAGGGHRVEPGK